MKRKLSLGKWAVAAVVLIAVGYSSAAVSLPACNRAVRTWLGQNAPAGAKALGHSAEPAALSLPFLASVSFRKKFLLSPPRNREIQYERGTRWYAALFGLVIPIWTASDVNKVIAD